MKATSMMAATSTASNRDWSSRDIALLWLCVYLYIASFLASSEVASGSFLYPLVEAQSGVGGVRFCGGHSSQLSLAR